MIWRKVAQGLLAVWLVTCSFLAQSQCTRMVVTSDPAYPPLHWYDGETLQGASIEIAKRVLGDLKIDFEIRSVGPFPRVMALAERGEVDMVVTLEKNARARSLFALPQNHCAPKPGWPHSPPRTCRWSTATRRT